jgi:hypothetical protein
MNHKYITVFAYKFEMNRMFAAEFVYPAVDLNLLHRFTASTVGNEQLPETAVHETAFLAEFSSIIGQFDAFGWLHAVRYLTGEKDWKLHPFVARCV